MWRQGEHLALIGSTGTGKTTLAERLLTYRHYVISLLTKTDDLAWRGYRTIKAAAEMDSARPNRDGSIRLILRVPTARRAGEFAKAMRRAYEQGGWTVHIDELYEMQLLGLEPDVVRLYSEGRSERVTVIGGMQRPSWVTRNGVSRWALSQPTHVFAFQTRDDRDVKVAGEIVGRAWSSQLPALHRFEFAYLNQVTGKTARGNVRTLKEVF